MKKIIIFLTIITLALSTIAYSIDKYEIISVIRNDMEIYFNNERVAGDNFIYNDTTYIPLRSISEMYHMKVDWDEENNIANINSKIDFIADTNKWKRINSDERNNKSGFVENSTRSLYWEDDVLITKLVGDGVSFIDVTNVDKINKEYFALQLSNYGEWGYELYALKNNSVAEPKRVKIADGMSIHSDSFYISNNKLYFINQSYQTDTVIISRLDYSENTKQFQFIKVLEVPEVRDLKNDKNILYYANSIQVGNKTYIKVIDKIYEIENEKINQIIFQSNDIRGDVTTSITKDKDYFYLASKNYFYKCNIKTSNVEIYEAIGGEY